MKIALLQADYVNIELQGFAGDLPEIFSQYLSNNSQIDLDIFNVTKNEFPSLDYQPDSYLITGSRNSVNDNLDWIRQLKNFVTNRVERGEKVIGICFGHQLLASACDTHEAIAFCMGETFKHYSLPVPPHKEILGTIKKGIGLSETLIELNPDLAEEKKEEVEEWVKAYRVIYNNGTGIQKSSLFPEVKEMFAGLKEKGVICVVVTNKGEKAVLEALQHHGVAPCIEMVIADDGKTPKKPDPQGFVTRIQPKFPSIPLEKILVVGDTHADIQYARNIGTQVCWASYGYGEKDKVSPLKPDLILKNPKELLSFL